MSGLDVVLIIIGAVLVIASYFFAEKKTEKSKNTESVNETAVKNVIETKMAQAKTQIESAAQVSAQMISEKTELELDKISNEKMQALNEYSEQVLEQINKNHEEVMFLYSMLNDKQNELNATAEKMTEAKEQTEQMLKSFEAVRLEAEETIKREEQMQQVLAEMIKQAESASMSIQTASSFVANTLNQVEPETKNVILEQESEIKDTNASEEEVQDKETVEIQEFQEKEEKPKKRTTRRTSTKTPAKKKTQKSEPVQAPDMDIQFDLAGQVGGNSNEMILELHKKGKSNMDIAKELGLGLGEVKLVIDLFEGVK